MPAAKRCLRWQTRWWLIWRKKQNRKAQQPYMTGAFPALCVSTRRLGLQYVRRLSYTPFVTINYMQMLLDLMEERQKWIEKRDESIREISRLSELIRATMNMIPADQIARYEPIFERIEKRPAGLTTAIRACYTGATGFAQALRQDMGKGSAGKDQKKDGAGVSGREAEESKSETSATGSAKDAWFTPVEIRDALKRMGFPFENYKANPL